VAVFIGIRSMMIGALMVPWPHGWMFDRQGGGWEYIAFLTAALLSIVALGDGRFSLDTLILYGSAAFTGRYWEGSDDTRTAN
jgi:uncharacterized membrane protein YphA (DoxX/SURF4 family)